MPGVWLMGDIGERGTVGGGAGLGTTPDVICYLPGGFGGFGNFAIGGSSVWVSVRSRMCYWVWKAAQSGSLIRPIRGERTCFVGGETNADQAEAA